MTRFAKTCIPIYINTQIEEFYFIATYVRKYATMYFFVNICSYVLMQSNVCTVLYIHSYSTYNSGMYDRVHCEEVN